MQLPSEGVTEERVMVEREHAGDHAMSVWGVEACTACGAAIVLGERVTRVERGGFRHVLCSTCTLPVQEAAPAAQGVPTIGDVPLSDLAEAA
jgi:hypothetical protein